LEGYIRNDNAVGAHKTSHSVRLKTLVAAAFFDYLFFAVDHIYRINMEQL
jgi:hypothetical protein